MLQTLTNATLQKNVIRMLHVATPKDLTNALVREDLKAPGELILLKSIHNHQNQSGTFLSSRKEIVSLPSLSKPS